MSDETLILYGVPASQPSRAVYWTCLMRELAFELRTPDLLGGGDADLTRLNPKRQLPTIVLGDFVLYEMPAILAWLCNRNGWLDLYPGEPEARALVDQYLHFHHSTTRLATMTLMAPHVTIAFGGMDAIGGDTKDVLLRDSIRSAMTGPDVYERGRATAVMVAELIEAGYFCSGDFLCTADRPTIADIACYEELAQLRWASLFDFEGFHKLRPWLDRMAALPCHENAHRYNFALGDIKNEPITMERFVAAGEAGLAALAELGVSVPASG